MFRKNSEPILTGKEAKAPRAATAPLLDSVGSVRFCFERQLSTGILPKFTERYAEIHV
jgi:hypothetical protein